MPFPLFYLSVVVARVGLAADAAPAPAAVSNGNWLRVGGQVLVIVPGLLEHRRQGLLAQSPGLRDG